MAQVITFSDYTPVPRYDGNPWTEVDIEEGETVDGPWVVIETILLSPVDADPENPATRSFTTEDASDTVGLWYRLVFRDGTGDEQSPTLPVQNTITVSAYVSVSELFRVLDIRTPTSQQRDAGERVLLAAAGEIDHEIALAEGSSLSSWQLALAAEVNLERAVEHWRQQESPFGLVGLGGVEVGITTPTARNSWERHAEKLAVLKDQWGIA